MELYTTCPPSRSSDPAQFRRRVVEVARWSEAAGFRGSLVYTDNGLADPWAVAQLMVASTSALVPLIAVQPMYMHPFTAARMVSSIAHLYGRSVDINLVTGGNRDDFRALGWGLDHDARYRLLVEYGTVMARLLAGEAVTSKGEHYTLDEAALHPPMVPDLLPRLFVAGSSEISRAASRTLGAHQLAYPRRVEHYAAAGNDLRGAGVRFGIIARDTGEEAWRVARERFGPHPDGERDHFLALLGRTDSEWFWQLSRRHEPTDRGARSTYWLYPFHSHRVFCPYLVGSHHDVVQVLSQYVALGVKTLLVDTPVDEDDLHHILQAVGLLAVPGPTQAASS